MIILTLSLKNILKKSTFEQKNLIKESRIRILQSGNSSSGPVVYWMSRDQRVHDNWALFYAQEIAIKESKELIVIFNLVSDFLEATIRQYGFMIKGLQEVEEELFNFKIPFILLRGKPEIEIPKFLSDINASSLISDFDPLKIKRIWKREVAKKIEIPFLEVDAHNIVPCLYASNKLEFAAYTIRPKIHKLLPEFMDEFPQLKKMRKKPSVVSEVEDWEKIISSFKINKDVAEVDWIKPGEAAASVAL